MAVKKIAKSIKGAGRAAVSTSKWAFPFSPKIDDQLEYAMRQKEIQKAFSEYSGDPENFKNNLRYYIEQENMRNYKMRKFAGTLDTVNKATVPIDAVLDYFIIMGGVGAAGKAISTLAKLPGYLAYDAYYLAKTGDFSGVLKNVAYEAGSWLMLGSLPHLFNYYSHQADKYAVKQASQHFLKGLEKTAQTEFEKKLSEKKGRKTLEDLSKAA